MNCIEHWKSRIIELEKEREKLLENLKKNPNQIREIENDLLFKKFIIDRESYKIKEGIVSIEDNDLSVAMSDYDKAAISYDMPLYNVEDCQYVFTKDTPVSILELEPTEAFEYWKVNEAFSELEHSNSIEEGKTR